MIRPFKIGCSCIAGRQIVSDYVNKVYRLFGMLSKAQQEKECHFCFNKIINLWKHRAANNPYIANAWKCGLMYRVRTHQLRHSQRYHMIVKYRQVDNRQVDWF